jgi:hypothetical protein
VTAKYKKLLSNASGDLLQSVEQLLESYVLKNDESPVAVAARQSIAKATGAVVLRCQFNGCGSDFKIKITESKRGRPRTKYCSDYCRNESHRATATERVRLSRQRRREALALMPKITEKLHEQDALIEFLRSEIETLKARKRS